MTLNSLSNIKQIPIEETSLRVFLTEEQADFLTKKGVRVFFIEQRQSVYGIIPRRLYTLITPDDLVKIYTPK